MPSWADPCGDDEPVEEVTPKPAVAPMQLPKPTGGLNLNLPKPTGGLNLNLPAPGGGVDEKKRPAGGLFGGLNLPPPKNAKS